MTKTALYEQTVELQRVIQDNFPGFEVTIIDGNFPNGEPYAFCSLQYMGKNVRTFNTVGDLEHFQSFLEQYVQDRIEATRYSR